MEDEVETPEVTSIARVREVEAAVFIEAAATRSAEEPRAIAAKAIIVEDKANAIIETLGE